MEPHHFRCLLGDLRSSECPEKDSGSIAVPFRLSLPEEHLVCLLSVIQDVNSLSPVAVDNSSESKISDSSSLQLFALKILAHILDGLAVSETMMIHACSSLTLSCPGPQEERVSTSWKLDFGCSHSAKILFWFPIH
jgi:hypothetical protein